MGFLAARVFRFRMLSGMPAQGDGEHTQVLAKRLQAARNGCWPTAVPPTVTARHSLSSPLPAHRSPPLHHTHPWACCRLPAGGQQPPAPCRWTSGQAAINQEALEQGWIAATIQGWIAAARQRQADGAPRPFHNSASSCRLACAACAPLEILAGTLVRSTPAAVASQRIPTPSPSCSPMPS